MSAASTGTTQSGPQGRAFATRYLAMLALLGGGAGALLAWSLKDEHIVAEFWKQIITLVGVTTLPIVAVAMRTPGYATERWRLFSAVAVPAVLVLVFAVIGLSLHELAQFVKKDEMPSEPSEFSLFAVCIGAGVVVAGTAAGVVIAFFEKYGTMEAAKPDTGGPT
ncbi:MAG TPA: hypothetical protein VN238_06065 [Solirubrobacteraceae bacterium]|nr:hypothetical protein [Solirubrobacteraceae bacterium]